MDCSLFSGMDACSRYGVEIPNEAVYDEALDAPCEVGLAVVQRIWPSVTRVQPGVHLVLDDLFGSLILHPLHVFQSDTALVEARDGQAEAGRLGVGGDFGIVPHHGSNQTSFSFYDMRRY